MKRGIGMGITVIKNCSRGHFEFFLLLSLEENKLGVLCESSA